MSDRMPVKLDIDGTLRRERSPWRYLHRYFSLSEQARDFVQQYNEGIIDYEAWVRLDTALWKGIRRQDFIAALAGKPIRDGAVNLVEWFACRSIPCLAISSGISLHNQITAEALCIEQVYSNEVCFEDDTCTGLAKIHVTESNKGEILGAYLMEHNIYPESVVCFGDGPADIELFQKVGLSIAIMPTTREVRETADHSIEEEPIDSALQIVEAYITNLASRDSDVTTEGKQE